MNKSEQINELSGALAKAQGAVKSALKDSNNPFFKSKYADLSSIWEACRKALSDNGLAVTQLPFASEGNSVGIETLLLQSSGQWLGEKMVVPVAKFDAQGIGSAITYARRYALASVVGVVADEDDDGESAVGRNGKKQTIANDPVDKQKAFKAAVWFKEIIDADQIEEHHEKVKTAWERLSNDERMAVHEQLGVKADGSKRMYKNILKLYLDHVPEESIPEGVREP